MYDNSGNFHISKISYRVWLWTAKTSNGLAPLHFRILVDGLKTEISLGIKIPPKDWDSKKQVVKKSNASFELYNAQLLEVIAKFSSATLYLRSTMNEYVTAKMIRDLMFGREVKKKPITVEDLIKDFLLDMEKGSNEESTFKKYKVQTNALLLFLEHENKRSIQISELTTKVMTDYQTWLFDVKKLENATALKYLKAIKTVFLYAVRSEYCPNVPFATFRAVKEKKKPIVYLTEAELALIENKHFESQRLSEVKDFFLLQCYTGMAYADLGAIRPEDFQTIDDRSWIIKNRKKSDVIFQTPVLRKAYDIFAKYGFKVPLKCNQRMNEYLREIGEICGITKHLTTHVGRKTFATTSLTRGVPIETVSKMVGHTSTRMTLSHYAEIVSSKMIKDIEVMED